MSILSLDKIRKKASGLIENKLLKTGRVLEVRHWEKDTIIEIDLHLPETVMDKWNDVQYIKCKVSDFTLRDYTPAGWDAETQTCTLYIDATHPGAGSLWAKSLKTGDKISYLGSSSTRHAPAQTSAVIGLGDESSLGHVLALEQLTLPLTRFAGAVVMDSNEQCDFFSQNIKSSLQPLAREDGNSYYILMQWIADQKYNLANKSFYIAGNSRMVVELRKWLKEQGFNQIKAHGFWN